MRHWRKPAGWIIGSAVLLAVAFMLVLPALFNGERIKQVAQEKAQQTWSRELSIETLSLRLRPFPELHAQNVMLMNPEWAKEKIMLKAASVTARLELLPLLRRKIQITGLAVDDFHGNVETRADGVTNWTLNRKQASQESNGTSGVNFSRLNWVRIRNAHIRHQNSGREISAWDIDTFEGAARPGLRDVEIEARVVRNKHPLRLYARFDDLSRLGSPGAVSEGLIKLRWNESHLILQGKLPLQRELQAHDVQARLTTTSLADIAAFFGMEERKTAAIDAAARLHDADGRIAVTGIRLGLGDQTITGTAQLRIAGPKPVIDMQISADRIDWARLMRDAGRPPPPAKPAEEMFDTHPLGWHAVETLQQFEGAVAVRAMQLKMRSGVELKDFKARIDLGGSHLNIAPFSANLLGGSMSGSLLLDAAKKTARLKFEANDILLARWFSERGRQVSFTGGPMEIRASLSSSGASMKDLAHSLTGPVSIRMGPGMVVSKKAGEIETLLTGMLAGDKADRINLQCVAAQLPFQAGRAAAEPIVGARSDTSQMLTAGYVDLREQVLDLRGRIRAAEGISLGVSTVAGDMRIAGKITRPKFGLDPAGTPEALARLGAAVATGGLSIIGSALWDAASVKGDPCSIAAIAGKPSRATKQSR